MVTPDEKTEIRNASAVALVCVGLFACLFVGCCKEQAITPSVAPIEHSVLVLPPDVEQRIKTLENERRFTDVIELSKALDELDDGIGGRLTVVQRQITALESEVADLKKNQCKCHCK